MRVRDFFQEQDIVSLHHKSYHIPEVSVQGGSVIPVATLSLTTNVAADTASGLENVGFKC
jgi:hypothetical protein